jgi:hypothetical protein
MIANLTKLSQALDQAAPDRKLAAAIRSNKDRIEADIAREGCSFITVNGQRFRVLPRADKKASD